MTKPTHESEPGQSAAAAYPANILALARVFLMEPDPVTPDYVRSFSDLPAFGQVADAMEALVDGFNCDCRRQLPWPSRVQDETCPDCGAVWEHDGVDLGGGARLKQLGRLPGEPVEAFPYETEPAQADATEVVRQSIETGRPVIVEDDEATPEERLLLAIYGADPDDAHNVRELRKHAVTCTKDDHSYCLAYLPGIPGRDEADSCPRCRAVDWGQTPDGRDECTRCGWAEPKLVTP
jgi:hypothetical protein